MLTAYNAVECDVMDDGALDDVTLARLAAGHLGPTVRYAALDGPIDHRLFCHLSRSLQALQLTSIDTVREALQQTTTRSGLRVVCERGKRSYASGLNANPEFLAHEPTIRDHELSAYNYKFSPN